jgi:hypothetical protein
MEAKIPSNEPISLFYKGYKLNILFRSIWLFLAFRAKNRVNNPWLMASEAMGRSPISDDGREGKRQAAETPL